MSIFTNQKTWFFIALFFIVVNIVLIAGRFMHGRGHGHGKYHSQQADDDKEKWSHRGHRGGFFLHAKFIADTLHFNEEQRNKLETIEKESSVKRDSAMRLSEESKLNFSLELFSKNPDKTKLDSLSLLISKSTENYNRLRMEKVFKIRELCTPEQLNKFSEILSEMSKRKSKGHFNN